MIAHLLLAVSDSELLAPGGMLVTAAGLFALGMRTYKESRNIDVEGEKARRLAAEEREKATESGLHAKLQPLRDEIAALKVEIQELRAERAREIQEMRAEQGRDRANHDVDMDRLRDQYLAERRKAFLLRQVLDDNGLPIPEGLGPS